MGRKSRRHAIKDTVTTDKYLAKQPRTRDQVLQKYGRYVLSTEIDFLLNEALQRSCHPYLKDEVCVYERLEGDCKEYGDYLCRNIVRVCELLRSTDPKLFDKTKPTDIAKEIMSNFPVSKMIKGLNLHDVGFLSFRLDGEWMVERIRKNIEDGIMAWAPIALAKTAIVDFPTWDIDSEMRADRVRSSYIRDTLVNMLEYSGVTVSSRMRNKQSLRVVKKCFPEVHGVIRNQRKSKSFFVIEGEASNKAQPNNAHEDLAALWCGIYEQKAEWIIYVTPLRQQEYIKKCFSVVEGSYKDINFADFRAFENNDFPTLSYLGYQTSDDEQGKLASLWEEFEHGVLNSFLEGGMPAEYSAEEVFECAIKYEYLKKNRYSDCSITTVEMLSLEGNTFMYLLKAQFTVRKMLELYESEVMSNKPQQALEGTEREMGLHLLQFTEIVEESFLAFTPHFVCEYVWNLSKNFTSYSEEVRLLETSYLLLKATEVVMKKCFDLLGVTPGSSKGLASYLKQQSGKPIAIRDHYMPSPVSRKNPKSCLTSRFEVFSMYVSVSHEFESGNLFGNITLSDTHGLLSDGWCKMDVNGCGHVAFFDKDWHNSVGIRSSSFLSLGCPSSRRTVSFASSIEIGMYLFVTTKDKGACYQLCYCEDEVDLSEFWDGDKSLKRRSYTGRGDNGHASIFCALIKDAVDTCMSLSYKPTRGHPKVSGSILAYYDGGFLDGCGGDEELYKAEIFYIEPTILKECTHLPLKKSTLSVPADGILVIETLLKDEDSGEYIVKDKRKFPAKAEGKDHWLMEGSKCSFSLIVDWTRDQGCS